MWNAINLLQRCLDIDYRLSYTRSTGRPNGVVWMIPDMKMRFLCYGYNADPLLLGTGFPALSETTTPMMSGLQQQQQQQQPRQLPLLEHFGSDTSDEVAYSICIFQKLQTIVSKWVNIRVV
jgi:hypothetical protein